MFEFEHDAEDDADFVKEVTALVHGAVEAWSPAAVVVVKVDTWFGSKWLGFSHKVMGAFGVASPWKMVIPPFVPNRVVSERTYKRVGPIFAETPGASRLHIYQTSKANARRKLKDSHPTAALFWWTGNTRQAGRGALMAYLPTPKGHTGWYAGLKRDGAWGFAGLCGVGVAQLRALQVRAAEPGASSGQLPPRA